MVSVAVGHGIEAIVDTLRVESGDILLVRFPSDIGESGFNLAAMSQTYAENLSRSLHKRGFENVDVVVCFDDFRVEDLDEDMMRAHGWVRAE